MEKGYVIQTITIGKDQQEFLNEYRKEHKFILSRFIQTKLDEYIRFLKLRGYANEKGIN